MSTSVTYLRYELLRTVRNTRFFIFSLVFPLILFYVVAGANKTLTVVKQVENGGGGMPAFKNQLTAQQIADVSTYVTQKITK